MEKARSQPAGKAPSCHSEGHNITMSLGGTIEVKRTSSEVILFTFDVRAF